MDDEAFVSLVRDIDDAIDKVDGRCFRVTPLVRADRLAIEMDMNIPTGGRIWVKNETGNVSGSHKARHLMGVMLHLAWRSEANPPRLAIASCGNAGLAAAVVARAVERPLNVFIPTDADPIVVQRLRALKAEPVSCPRIEGEAGDPSVLRFREAVSNGALPFTCQGSDNGLTIEGGHTLGYEAVDQLEAERGLVDRVFIQVGGAALASGVMNAFIEVVEARQIGELPRLHTVQTRGGFPLARAYERLAVRIDARLAGRTAPPLNPRGEGDNVPHEDVFGPDAITPRHLRADRILAEWKNPVVQEELRFAATHRSLFMWPWEDTPHSIAHGILDDETYDWFAVVRGMLCSGGFPIVVYEDELEEANRLARTHTDIPADHTGTSGLAGLYQLRQAGMILPEESLLVFFTGIDRAVEAAARE